MRPPSSRTGASTNKDVRPLTRRYIGTGEPYERLPEVEEQVRHVLALEEQELVVVIQHDYKSAGHIKDETLCYLIRERVRDGRNVDANAIAEVLLHRHTRTISSRLSRGGVEERHHEDCAAEIVSQLLTELFDTDSDDGEFAQVRFGLHFDRLSRTVIGRFRRLQQQERQAGSVALTHGDGGEEIDVLDTLADGHALSAEERVLMREALSHLPVELREPYLLRYYDGWQIESNSPAEPSISRQLNVTPRTIRNRLRDAEAALRRWREEG